LRQPHNEQAWGRLVELYTPFLFSWARRCGQTDHDAADLVQEVFVVLLQTLPTFQLDQHGRFRNWLRTLLVNKLRDRKRREALMHKVSLADCPEPALAADNVELWEREYHRQVTQRALELMRADFSPSTWKACWQFVAEGKPALDVAKSLGISENAVYLARCRVLRRLREELGGLVD
jgi:RNA polymerase sigma-70 factor (ECF subfamily)